MGCNFSNNKSNTNEHINNSINDISENSSYIEKTEPLYKLKYNPHNFSLKFMRTYFRHIISYIHKTIFLNTSYDICTYNNIYNIYKIKYVKHEQNEIKFILNKYSISFYYHRDTTCSIHIVFLDDSFNKNLFALKNNIGIYTFVNNYLKNIEFTTFENLNYSINGYFDFPNNIIKEKCQFNINCLNKKIETFILIPLVLPWNIFINICTIK